RRSTRSVRSRRNRFQERRDTPPTISHVIGLSLTQTVLPVFAQRREEITDDAALAGADLGRDRHPGCEVDQFVLDLDLGAVERDPRGVDRTLVVRRGLCGLRPWLRLVLHRVLRVVLAYRVR